MQKATVNRIKTMSRMEALGIITNLQANNVPPYRLHTHPTEFFIHTFAIDCDKNVNPENKKSEYAFGELTMARVREIAETIARHPSLGEEVLCAMMQGKKVAISMERAAPKNIRMVQPMQQQSQLLN